MTPTPPPDDPNPRPDGGESTSHDRMRDLLDGRLPAAEADRVRAEIAADAALRADFDRFRDVHEMTALPGSEPPAPRVTADDVLRAARPVRRLRPWMAAAAIVAAAAAGIAANLLVQRPAEVALAALHAGPPFPPVIVPAPPGPPPAPVPDALADFRPVVDGKPNWLTSFDDARALAAASGRAMLVWVHHPRCPLCVKLDRETFLDAGVRADVEAFVPVKVDVEELDQESGLARSMMAARAWPYIAVMDADGRTLKELPGVWEVADVRPKLDQAVEKSAMTLRPAWDDVRAAASGLRDAERTERDGRLGEALAAARRASDALAAHERSPVAVRARGFAESLERRAQAALEHAATTADAAAALPSLDAAAQSFAGVSEGTDLAAVAAAIRDRGVFPRLRREEGRQQRE